MGSLYPAPNGKLNLFEDPISPDNGLTKYHGKEVVLLQWNFRDPFYIGTLDADGTHKPHIKTNENENVYIDPKNFNITVIRKIKA
jgi:hypothetical protein